MSRELVIIEAERLTHLLTHPEPGLASWHEACERVYQRLVATAALESPHAAELATLVDDCRHDIKGLQAECDENMQYAIQLQELLIAMACHAMPGSDWRERVDALLAKNPTEPGRPGLAEGSASQRLPAESCGQVRPLPGSTHDEQLTGSRQCSSGRPHDWLGTFLYRDETTRSARVCAVCYRIELLDVSSSCNAREGER